MKALTKPPTPAKGFLIQLPANERGVDAGQLKRFDKLQRKLLRPDLKPSQREATRNELDSLIAAPQEAQERAWREGAVSESLTLAQARGEDVDIKRNRILSQHGIHTLYEARVLTQAQYDTAHECKKAYESRSADVGSQMGAEASGAGHDNNQFVANRFKRAKLLQMICEIERKLAMSCRDEPACLQMFRAVVGQGITIRSFGAGSAHRRHTFALKRALDVAEPIVEAFTKKARDAEKAEAKAA